MRLPIVVAPCRSDPSGNVEGFATPRGEQSCASMELELGTTEQVVRFELPG